MTVEKKRPLTPAEIAILRVCLARLEQAEADYQEQVLADALISTVEEQRSLPTNTGG